MPIIFCSNLDLPDITLCDLQMVRFLKLLKFKIKNGSHNLDDLSTPSEFDENVFQKDLIPPLNLNIDEERLSEVENLSFISRPDPPVIVIPSFVSPRIN